MVSQVYRYPTREVTISHCLPTWRATATGLIPTSRTVKRLRSVLANGDVQCTAATSRRAPLAWVPFSRVDGKRRVTTRASTIGHLSTSDSGGGQAAGCSRSAAATYVKRPPEGATD